MNFEDACQVGSLDEADLTDEVKAHLSAKDSLRLKFFKSPIEGILAHKIIETIGDDLSIWLFCVPYRDDSADEAKNKVGFYVSGLGSDPDHPAVVPHKQKVDRQLAAALAASHRSKSE